MGRSGPRSVAGWPGPPLAEDDGLSRESLFGNVNELARVPKAAGSLGVILTRLGTLATLAVPFLAFSTSFFRSLGIRVLNECLACLFSDDHVIKTAVVTGAPFGLIEVEAYGGFFRMKEAAFFGVCTTRREEELARFPTFDPTGHLFPFDRR